MYPLKQCYVFRRPSLFAIMFFMIALLISAVGLKMMYNNYLRSRFSRLRSTLSSRWRRPRQPVEPSRRNRGFPFRVRQQQRGGAPPPRPRWYKRLQRQESQLHQQQQPLEVQIPSALQPRLWRRQRIASTDCHKNCGLRRQQPGGGAKSVPGTTSNKWKSSHFFLVLIGKKHAKNPALSTLKVST